jgi:hypothetical protein
MGQKYENLFHFRKRFRKNILDQLTQRNLMIILAVNSVFLFKKIKPSKKQYISYPIYSTNSKWLSDRLLIEVIG